MKITRDNTALLVVDYQERIVPAMDKHEALIQKTRILLQGLSALSVPFVVTRQYPKGLGETVSEIIDCIPNYQPMDKTAFSCLGDKAICEHVVSLGKKYAIVCGIEAHVCVLQTVLDLIDAGITPILVADCISSRNPFDKELALSRAGQSGAILTTAESILFELLGQAGTAEFKIISKLIR